jgi:hypothetical protein
MRSAGKKSSRSNRVRLCRQAHRPEIDLLIPTGRLDPSGVPGYNPTVEVVDAARPAVVEGP